MSLRPAERIALALLYLASGLFAGRLALRAWRSVVEYAPPYRFEALTEAGPELDWRVILIVVDGLRQDASIRMPGLNGLRAAGADLVASAVVPSYSRPARASLVTGATPDLHGATTNRDRRRVALDNLFRGVKRTEGEVVVVGSELWRSLFESDLSAATILDAGPGHPPGAFAAVLPAMYRFEWDGLATILQRKPRIGVLDLSAPDYAGHEYGPRSPQYSEACGVADRVIQRVVDEADLWRTLVVVTADHGLHAARGHGGDEPEVLRVPLVLAGRGVRVGAQGVARQVDVAPTIAALLGLPIPAGSEGRVLEEVLDLEGQEALGKALKARVAAQQASFRSGLAAGLGVPAGSKDAREARLAADRARRLWTSLGVLGLAAALVSGSTRRAPLPSLLAAVAGAAVHEAVFRIGLAASGLPLTLSAVRGDEEVGPFFSRVVAAAALASLVAVVVVAIAASRRRGAPLAADLALHALTGVILMLLARILIVYWRQGLSMTWTIGELGRGFDAILGLARIQGASLAALVPLLLWPLARSRRAGLSAGIAVLMAAATPAQAGGIHVDVPEAPDPKARWAIYLHGRIVELKGRNAVHPEFGSFAYDAIVEALAKGGLEVVSEVRRPSTTFEYSARIATQVGKLKQAGVASTAITVIGFSKGAALARRAAAQLRDPDVRFVILAGCPRKEENFEPWVPQMAGRMLSLYDRSDDIVGSCQPGFQKAAAVRGSESVLSVGKRHGTFFEPRPEWLEPVLAFATQD